MRAKRVFALLSSGYLLAVPITHAANSFTNSLIGFTSASTNLTTQSVLAAAGLEVADLNVDPQIVFGATGPRFGSITPGDYGRNYMRTIAADYASVNFEAVITVVLTNIDDPFLQQAYFGVGGGGMGLWGNPDWSWQVSSVAGYIDVVNPSGLATFRTQDDINQFVEAPAILANGTHRLRMVFDSVAKTMTFSIDLNSAGGSAFTADVTAAPVDVAALYGPTGWPAEPSRIFFGGDDNVLFKNLVVNVTSSVPPSLRVARVAPASVSLNWPTNAASFHLQRNPGLNPVNWANVTNVPAVVGDEKQVTLTLTSNLFFRLISP